MWGFRLNWLYHTTEVGEALEQRVGDERKLELSFATGRLAYGFIRKYMDWIQEKYPNVKVHGYQIVNDFFGEKITVSGLLTGQDVIAQLKNKELGEYLLLPCNQKKSMKTMTRKHHRKSLL